MQYLAKKYLLIIWLMISLLANVAAQENTYSFKWFDRSEKELAGSISIKLVPDHEEGRYRLDLQVTWFDATGNVIRDSTRMPWLCLSKYDFTLAPAQNVRCLSFDQNKVFNPVQTHGSLVFSVLNGYQGKIILTAGFQYALTKELYDEGKWELINFMGANKIVFEFQAKPVMTVAKKDLATDNKSPDDRSVKNAETMRLVSESFKRTRSLVNGYETRKFTDQVNRPNYQQELEELSAGITRERGLLNPDSLQADSFLFYRDLYNRLNEKVLELRSDYLGFLAQQSNRASGSVLSSQIASDDSLRTRIKDRFESSIQAQVDSLTIVAEKQKGIATAIAALLSETGRGKGRGRMLDSLEVSHDLLKQAFLVLKLSHETSWNKYRIDIDTLMPVREIENLHSIFLTGQNDLQQSIYQVDNNLSTVRPGADAVPWYMSNLLIWTGLLGILILVFVSAIWSYTRSKKILKEQLNSLDIGIPGIQAAKSKESGFFSIDSSNEYFTLNYVETIGESAVGIVHYNSSAIKSVYQLLNGALLERNGADFGGYLFGNQYKLPGAGSGRSELFIEKACHSKYLRSSISNDIGARADLVDELDELVKQNKKYRLIGWFSSSIGNSMEIPEGLMKIHRSFFKEKWQLGILINPGSDVFQGASFLRRKSGYLDPMPDPSAFLKWEELYRFALNPLSAAVNDSERADNRVKDYSRIALNNTWGDSIVAGVNFDIPVVKEILNAASNQAIPKDTFQVVGYLYGSYVASAKQDGKSDEYEVFIDRFIELNNELTPREIPGLSLIGWWGQAKVDVMTYVQSAADYHEQSYREPYQISCLVNPSTGELRILTRKNSLEMNNSTIETEEYALNSLLSR